jgi:hypothetical protein
LASRTTVHIISAVAIVFLGNAFDSASSIGGHVIATWGAGSVTVRREVSDRTWDTLNANASVVSHNPLFSVTALGLILIIVPTIVGFGGHRLTFG